MQYGKTLPHDDVSNIDSTHSCSVRARVCVCVCVLTMNQLTASAVQGR